jgi:hypothetical protein
MNNRKTTRALQRAANPRGEKEERQYQRQANELCANIVSAGDFACRG